MRAPTTNISIDAVTAGSDDVALAAYRAEVERMELWAKESDEGAIEWVCWYLREPAFVSDDPSRWPAQSRLSLFRSKGRRRKPEEGELTLTRAAMEAIKAASESSAAGIPVTLPTNPWEPARRGPGNPASDYSRRDRTIKRAVRFLQSLGYNAMRNAATADHERGESAASIIAQALRRLGIKMSERRIEAYCGKGDAKSRKRQSG
jgi:hypothetical protein